MLPELTENSKSVFYKDIWQPLNAWELCNAPAIQIHMEIVKSSWNLGKGTWLLLLLRIDHACSQTYMNECICNITIRFYNCLLLSLVYNCCVAAATAAKSLQSCLTLCDHIDCSPSGFPIPGILQAKTLEWVAISFSNAWKWKAKVKSLSHVWLLATPWTVAYQAPPSMGFSRQEYWSGVPSPSPIIAVLVIL